MLNIVLSENLLNINSMFFIEVIENNRDNFSILPKASF